jgi:hypothetical protein
LSWLGQRWTVDGPEQLQLHARRVQARERPDAVLGWVYRRSSGFQAWFTSERAARSGKLVPGKVPEGTASPQLVDTAPG